jgi:hypothetical protein
MRLSQSAVSSALFVLRLPSLVARKAILVERDIDERVRHYNCGRGRFGDRDGGSRKLIVLVCGGLSRSILSDWTQF